MYICVYSHAVCVCVLQHQSFPQSKSGFRVGMRLEGIDPLHPSMYCVLSVAEVTVHRRPLVQEYPVLIVSVLNIERLK